MTLQLLLDQKNMTKYNLSKISGVPKTTVLDICAGRSSLGRCSAKTVQQLAHALDCPMETLMLLEEPAQYDAGTGLPANDDYLEHGLPEYLRISIKNMKESWAREDSGQRDDHWDLYWGELNADINAAENDQTISPEQAWHLRKKYLRMGRDELT